jgi:hypothetical protein
MKIGRLSYQKHHLFAHAWHTHEVAPRDDLSLTAGKDGQCALQPAAA